MSHSQFITNTYAAIYGGGFANNEACVVRGWICDNSLSDFGTIEIHAHLYKNATYQKGGVYVDQKPANLDLETVHGYCGNSGDDHWFNFTNIPNGTYYINVVGASDSSNPPLQSSPIVLNCTTAAKSTPSPKPGTSPTQSPTVPTTGNVSIQMDSIGLDDNANPLHPTRQLTLYFYPATDTSFQQKPKIFSGTVSYNQTTGFFTNASFPLPGLTAGQYLVLVRSTQGSLLAQIGSGDGTGPITITTTGGTNTIVDTQSQNADNPNAATKVPLLLMGDLITSDPSFNSVDSLDYSVVKDCFGATETSQSDACKQHTGIIDATTHVLLPDMNDDGVVDGVDYTIMLRNFHRSVVGIQKDPASN